MKETGANINSDEELFASIYERYMPTLRVLAKRYGVSYDDIEDVVQEVFISYYNHYPLTWEEYKIKAMLSRILRNRCVDYLRRKSKRPVTCRDPQKMQGTVMVPLYEEQGKDSLVLYLEKEENRKIFEVLNTMREDWAQVFYLYAIQGRPIEEVSELLGTTDAACRTRLTRGRKYLKEHLDQT